jgi:hypothetical protein
MSRERVRRVTVIVAAVWLFVGLSVAPVSAAASDDGLLDDDLLGGDDGLVGDDGVNVGGDDGVSVGVDDGVNASVAGDDGVAVGVGGDEGVEASVAGQEVTEGAPTGVTDDVAGIGGDTAPDAVGGDTLPTGDAPVPGAGDGLNVTDATGVEVCDLARVDSNKLPTGSLPGLDALPSELAPPGVPTNLLTAETLVGLATGGAPGACEVVDLEDPQVDPTNPSLDPDGTFDVLRMEPTDDGAALWLTSSGTLDDAGDGPGFSSSPGAVVGADNADIEPDLVFNAGASEYGAEPVIERADQDDIRLRGVVILVGKNAGGEIECTDFSEFDGDLSEETLADLGPCEYELVGIPSLFTPEDLLEILGSAGSGGAPVDPGGLPVDPDDLLSL